MRKAFVLLSGGLDSTTCLYVARKESFDEVEAVSMHYGQRHSKEIECARKICEDLGIVHCLIDLGDLLAAKDTMLTNKDIDIPNIDYSEIQGVSPTYVPFRNGTMLSALTAHAQKWVNAQLQEHNDAHASLYFGAHAEDAHNWAYPDCTPEFIGAMANAIYIGSYMKIRLVAPLMNMVKSDIVELGYYLDVPFEDTWSCYAGGERHCGVCPTCRSRRQAFRASHIIDTTEYAQDIPLAAE
jgi:7-cyano-7-deazaguanine synthase